MESDYYFTHEFAYQALRKKRAPGWGDGNFQKRMKGWERTLHHARNNPHFPPPPSSILELGCGSGDVSLFLANAGYQISGIDISTTAIEWAREKFSKIQPSVDFRSGNVCYLPWEDSSFDVILDANCLHCIIGERDRSCAFSEIRRVLRPEGFFLISSMVGDPKKNQTSANFDFVQRYQMNGDKPIRFMPTANQLIDEISFYGFKIIHSLIKTNEWWDHMEAYALISK